MIATATAVAASSPAAAQIGMFAALGGFIAGWAIVILAVLFLFGILSEHNESSGWASFWLILSGLVAYTAFNIPLMALAFAAVAYIVIGLVWSFWRYKRYVEDKVEKHRSANEWDRKQVLNDIHPKKMLGAITAWIMVWPFSFVASFVGDLINFIQTLVTKFFRGVYFKIYDSAVAALK